MRFRFAAGATVRAALISARSAALVAAFPLAALAQFHSYPSFQVPTISYRDFNFAFADAGGGTAFIFQWREGAGSGMHLQLDAGLFDPEARGADARFVIGGTLAYLTHTASNELPLDMVVTAGIGGSSGGGASLLRIPIGLSVGHRFPVEGGIAITPYAHPRFAIDYCSSCDAGGDSEVDLGLDIDLGVDVALSQALAIRASVMIAGSDFVGRDDAFGLGVVWAPPQLGRAIKLPRIGIPGR